MLALVTCLMVVVFPCAVSAQMAGDWEVRVNTVIKKPPRDGADVLNGRFVLEYRYDEGLPPEPFWVGVGYSPQAFPQTLDGTLSGRFGFNAALVIIYEICPHQFELIEENDQTIGLGLLTLRANPPFPPPRRPGVPFQQMILHDWGDLYDRLGGVSVLNFGTSLDAMVLSAGLMMRDLRCADASVEECVEIISASARLFEPTREEVSQGIHGGETLHRCPAASDNSLKGDN